jgi:hypothetical protein
MRRPVEVKTHFSFFFPSVCLKKKAKPIFSRFFFATLLTFPKPCDSECIKVLSLNGMDDLFELLESSTAPALCRHWNGATVITSTETIAA